MEGLIENNKGDKLFGLLSSITFEPNFFKRLQALEVVFGLVDDKIANKVDMGKFKEFLLKYTEDQSFMRKTRMISVMEDNPESCLELYGFDYISSPDYQYDTGFMQKRRMIEKQINIFIGRLMKEYIAEEDMFSFGEDDDDSED